VLAQGEVLVRGRANVGAVGAQVFDEDSQRRAGGRGAAARVGRWRFAPDAAMPRTHASVAHRNVALRASSKHVFVDCPVALLTGI